MSSELDLDVDVCGQVDTHERIDGLRRRVDDVDEPLVCAHLKVLAAVLVFVGRPNDDKHVLFGRQWNRAHNSGACSLHGVHDLARGAVDDLVVIRLQPDADLLSRHAVLPLLVQIRHRSPHSGVSLKKVTHVLRGSFLCEGGPLSCPKITGVSAQSAESLRNRPTGREATVQV
ncbi:Uncharacterised protein [Chlamydia trachomatis]|nr:Uncharacterised protein [Chlamydia trachomatis]